MDKHTQMTTKLNIDLMLGLLTLSRRYNMGYEFTRPVHMLEAAWALPPKPQLPQYLVIFRAFPLYVWLALFATMALMITSLYVFSRTGVLNMYLADCFFKTANLLIAVNMRIPSRQFSVRILVFSGLFFAAHMNLFYNCSLTSMQTKPMQLPNPRNLEELIDSGIKIRTIEGTFGFLRLPENGTTMKRLRRKTEVDPRNDLNKVLVEYLRNPDCAVFASSVQYLIIKNKNELELINERVRYYTSLNVFSIFAQCSLWKVKVYLVMAI